MYLVNHRLTGISEAVAVEVHEHRPAAIPVCVGRRLGTGRGASHHRLLPSREGLDFGQSDRREHLLTHAFHTMAADGFREAGRCLVMQAKVAGRKLIMVLLDSTGKYSRIGDAERIRKWLGGSPVQAAPVVARKWAAFVA